MTGGVHGRRKNRDRACDSPIAIPDQRETTNVYDGAGNPVSKSQPRTFGQ
jgi:hypothetical protein